MHPLLDGLRILVLEDEVLIAMDVEQLCRDYGASDVIVCRDLAAIQTESLVGSFDAAIIDLMLGGTSTFEFARQLYAQKVPFVFASGYSEAAELEEEFPGVILVNKPYSGIDLVEAVAKSCGRPFPQVVGDAIT